jgi:signal peptidase II
MDRAGDPRAIGLATAGVVLLLDQVTKILAAESLANDRSVEVLGSLLRLGLKMNEGAAFSLSWGGPVVLALLSGVAVVALGYLLLSGRVPDRTLALCLGSIMGGAAGNLIDRILHGAVIDFIDIGAASWRWPTFNIADIGITLGGIGVVVSHLLLRRGGRVENEPEEDEGGTGPD